MGLLGLPHVRIFPFSVAATLLVVSSVLGFDSVLARLVTGTHCPYEMH